MLVGLLAGLLVFGFARWTGEPQVDRAIAYEPSMDKAKGEAPEPEMVSRPVQRGPGLLAGTVVFGTALGGIFGLVFAFSRGRLSQSRPQVLSALIAGISFVTIVLIPSLKYPANPPAVGDPDTIGIRTAAYFLLITISIVAMTLAIKARGRWLKSLGNWNATVLVGLLYIGVVTLCSQFMPAIDEVPSGFPASLLWNFRIASLETQVVLWSSLGLLFGWLTERAERVARPRGLAPSDEAVRTP